MSSKASTAMVEGDFVMGKRSIGKIDNAKWYLPLRCQSMPKIA
jgi:hypothetical protein